jgi:hypothetical protein
MEAAVCARSTYCPALMIGRNRFHAHTTGGLLHGGLLHRSCYSKLADCVAGTVRGPTAARTRETLRKFQTEATLAKQTTEAHLMGSGCELTVKVAAG